MLFIKPLLPPIIHNVNYMNNPFSRESKSPFIDGIAGGLICLIEDFPKLNLEFDLIWIIDFSLTVVAASNSYIWIWFCNFDTFVHSYDQWDLFIDGV